MKKKDSAVRWGLALFLTVGAILLFYDTLFGRRVLPSFGGQLLKALQPVSDRRGVGVPAGAGHRLY
ncbi:MAG: hypothetical protein V8R21_04225 [Dysosmobacter sp.]